MLDTSQYFKKPRTQKGPVGDPVCSKPTAPVLDHSPSQNPLMFLYPGASYCLGFFICKNEDLIYPFPHRILERIKSSHKFLEQCLHVQHSVTTCHWNKRVCFFFQSSVTLGRTISGQQ